MYRLPCRCVDASADHPLKLQMQVKIITFNAEEIKYFSSGCAPLCWMWNTLAGFAENFFRATWLLLLGDDVAVTPIGWPRLFLGKIRISFLYNGQFPDFSFFLS